MIEKNFAALREREEASRQEEVVRREQERLEGIKKKELARITNERRRENERRRTQEIKFNREDFEQMRATQTNGTEEREREAKNSGDQVQPGRLRTDARYSDQRNQGERTRGEELRRSSSTGKTSNRCA